MASPVISGLAFVLMLLLLVSVFAAVHQPKRAIYCIGVLLVILGGMVTSTGLGALLGLAGAVGVAASTVPLLRGTWTDR